MEKLPVPGAYKTFDGDHKDGEYGWKKSLGYLWQIVNVPPEYRMLLLAWLIHTTINEATAFPLLLVQAEQGSGKSWLLHILSRLIDPSRDTGGGLPANEDAFAVSALNSRLLLFDNLSRIPPQKSDLLCRASTGGTIRRRKLYTDATEGMYNIMRPIIITGINVGTVNPDLAERLVRIEMRRPDNRNRRSLSELKRLWSDHATDIYMGLLRLAAQVSDNLHIYTNEELPRMADFGVVCRALDDLCHVHVFDRYVAQQQSIAMEMVSDEPVFLALQQNRLMFATAVEVTSGELLRRLQPTLSLPADQLGTWKSAPKSAADLTRSLDICAPALRDRGWNVSWTKGTGNNSGSRLWTLKAPSENQ